MATSRSLSTVAGNGGDGGVLGDFSNLGSCVLAGGGDGGSTGVWGEDSSRLGGFDSSFLDRVFSDPVCKGADYYRAVQSYYAAVGSVRAAGFDCDRGLEYFRSLVGGFASASGDVGLCDYDVSGSGGILGQGQDVGIRSVDGGHGGANALEQGQSLGAGVVVAGRVAPSVSLNEAQVVQDVKKEGMNTQRNRRWRQEKKKKKQDRRAMGIDWRAKNRVVPRASEAGVGFSPLDRNASEVCGSSLKSSSLESSCGAEKKKGGFLFFL